MLPPVEDGEQPDDQDKKDPLARLGELPQYRVPEVGIRVIAPGDRPEERPEPDDRVVPHPIENLVARHARGHGEEVDPPAVDIEEETGEGDQEEDGEAVEVYPAVVERPGEDDMPERLIDQVGEHGAQRGERDDAPIPDENRQHKADEYADHDVGEEVHRETSSRAAIYALPRGGRVRDPAPHE